MINPSEIYTEAKRLATTEGIISEARQRTVLGRIYYGVYHAVDSHETLGPIIVAFDKEYRERRNNNNQLKHLTAHKMMQEALLTHRDAGYRYLGAQLRTLFDRRILADYRLNHRVPPNFVTDSLDIAEEILAEYLGMDV